MNRVILIGRLTRDPDVRHTGETMVARYTLAVDRGYKAQDGQATADFISCVAFGKRAEFAEKYLQKGTKIAVVGSVRTGSYKDKEGRTIYTTDVSVDSHEFVESRKEKEQEPPSQTDDGFVHVPEGIDEELPFV